MIEVVKATSPDTKDALVRALASVDLEKETAVLIRYARDAGEVADMQHDLNGALRSFRYLAEKVKQGYDPNDVRGQKMMESIDRHVDGLGALKDKIERIFGV
jgi:hypothetical protein